MALKTKKVKVSRGASSNAENTFAGALRQGRSKPNRFWERLLWFGALIAAIMILTDIGYKQIRIQKLREQLSEIERQINNDRFEHQRLLLEKEFRGTNAYIERMAREELGWLRPGDFIFRIP